MSKRLTLQITRPCFKAILQGKQKIEHRFIYPSNAKHYVTQTELPNGELEVECVPYETLYLINGRRLDAPRLEVKIEKAEFVILTDEDGNDMTFKEKGEEYFVCQVWYYLGDVVKTENVPESYFTDEVIVEYDETGNPVSVIEVKKK